MILYNYYITLCYITLIKVPLAERPLKERQAPRPTSAYSYTFIFSFFSFWNIFLHRAKNIFPETILIRTNINTCIMWTTIILCWQRRAGSRRVDVGCPGSYGVAAMRAMRVAYRVFLSKRRIWGWGISPLRRLLHTIGVPYPPLGLVPRPVPYPLAGCGKNLWHVAAPRSSGAWPCMYLSLSMDIRD